MQVDNRIAAVTERSALIGRWHIPVTPIWSAVDRAAAVIGEYYVARQIFILASQTVGHPAADARMAGEYTSGAHLKNRRTVRGADRIHRPDQGQIVGMPGNVWEEFGNIHAALTVLLELPWRRHQATRCPHYRPNLTDSRHGLTLPLKQFRLWIKGVDLTYASVTKDRDHSFGLGRKVLRFWCKR